MSSLKFSDGMIIKTDGELRMIRKSDGLYVVGRGMCIPVDSPEEAQAIIKDMKGGKHGKS